MSVRFSVVLVGLTFFSLGSQDCEAQRRRVREVRRVLLSDIGFAKVDRQGNPIVAINPRLCRQFGPDLCEFFRAHEYGHHNLRHFYRDISVQQAEAEADRYAARHSSPQARAAARQYFASGRGASRMHGSSADRLARVSGNSQSLQPRKVRVVRTRSQVGR